MTKYTTDWQKSHGSNTHTHRHIHTHTHKRCSRIVGLRNTWALIFGLVSQKKMDDWEMLLNESLIITPAFSELVLRVCIQSQTDRLFLKTSLTNKEKTSFFLFLISWSICLRNRHCSALSCPSDPEEGLFSLSSSLKPVMEK